MAFINPEKLTWRPYRASVNQPWNECSVVHLHRRAAFGATWNEIERDLAEGPEAALDRLLAPANSAPSVLSQELATQGIAQQEVTLLQAAWVMRMWHGPDPLGEQLTLMWHNHFATSNSKVRDCSLMWRQHELFRRHARDNFADLLHAVMRDPAMLIWLDADSNRRGHPNENLAREVMELFTLGQGNYTEDDVREAARALTGWRVEEGTATFEPSGHDSGVKTILGRTGRFGLDDLLEILVQHPATSRRLAWRICDHFFGPDVIPQSAIETLADQLRSTRLNIGSAIATVLRSELFFDQQLIGTRFRSPVSFIVSSTRSLERHQAGLSPNLVAGWLGLLGQDLFRPPGVAGWPGGRSWLGVNAMIERVRFASGLSDGTLYQSVTPVDLLQLARRRQRTESPIAFASRLLLGEVVDFIDSANTLPKLLASAAAQFD